MNECGYFVHPYIFSPMMPAIYLLGLPVTLPKHFLECLS